MQSSYFLFSACEKPDCKCDPYPKTDISRAGNYSRSDNYIFCFPLDGMDETAVFHQEGRKSPTVLHYHCAEDYHLPSGPMGD